MATHSSIFAGRIPMDRGAWQVTYSPRGCKESDMTEQLSTEQKALPSYKNIWPLLTHLLL